MALGASLKQGLFGGNILDHGTSASEKYLSWRRNCLLCALMLWVITLLMMLAILPSRKKKYTEAIAALGDVGEI